MSADSILLMEILTMECSHVFRGIRSIVDVGGGTGSTARTVANAFPEVKCIVLDLPHAIDMVTEKATINFVAGDMFTYILPADAVLLKWIMHDWGDDDCARILQCCKEAIPTKEDGGNVIIIHAVVNVSNSHHQSSKAQLYLDMVMMLNIEGLEREEHEDLAATRYIWATDTRSVIEVYLAITCCCTTTRHMKFTSPFMCPINHKKIKG
uniref:O-methyltransferase C-terminal domain-containing protein n=1 Tax=Ananas comosus var. bracteatus TaxID=296719 RepID=A0A6V7NYZ6_ANACO|nr:unnamed protein product [Ananas comosus var. bracteatus]